MQYSALAERDQIDTVKLAMEVLAKRNHDILSLSLLQRSGETIAQVGNHAQVWVQPPGDESTLEFLQVPIFPETSHGVCSRLRFRKLTAPGSTAFLKIHGYGSWRS